MSLQQPEDDGQYLFSVVTACGGAASNAARLRVGLLRDVNCDTVISVSDLGPIVRALTAPAAYATQFPDCDAKATISAINGALKAA